MTITLPADPATSSMGEAEPRLELARPLFAHGKVSSRRAATIAGVGDSELLDALAAHRSSYYATEMLREDIESLNKVFADDPLPLPPL